MSFLVCLILFLKYPHGQATCETDLTYFGHCLAFCPSGFKPDDKSCFPENPILIDITFSQDSLALTDKLQPSLKFFKETSNFAVVQSRGTFWSKKSWAEFENQYALAPFFTLQLWVLVLEPGKILTESRDLIELVSNGSSIVARYNRRVISAVWENTWTNFILTFQFLYNGELAIQLHSNSFMKNYFFEEFYKLSYSRVLGC